MNSEISKKLNIISLTWGIVVGLVGFLVLFLTFLDLLNKLIPSFYDKWIYYFIPDLLIFLFLIGVFPILLKVYGKKYYFSIRTIFSLNNKKQITTLIVLIILIIILNVFLFVTLHKYYRCRYFHAKFDWHYSMAKKHLRDGLLFEAKQEFDKQGNKFTYLGDSNYDYTIFIKYYRADINRRLNDAKNYIERFNNANKSKNSLVICR